MPAIPRHASVAPDFARSQVEGLTRRTPEVLEASRHDPHALQPVLTRMTMLAGFRLVPDPGTDDPEVRAEIGLAAEAGAAIFACATTEPGQPVVAVVGGPADLTGTGPYGAAGAVTWLNAFSFAAIARRPDLLDALCGVGEETLRAAGPQSDEFLYRWAAALRAYWTTAGDPPVGTRVYDELDAALAGTADDQLGVTPPAWARQVYRPLITLLGKLVAIGPGDPPDPTAVEAFNAALAEAVTGHKAYWGSGANATKSFGFVAYDPLAVACLARDRGVPVTVESDYLPAVLLDVPAPDRAAPAGSPPVPAVLDDAVRVRYGAEVVRLDIGTGGEHAVAGAWRVGRDDGERFVVAEALAPDEPLRTRAVTDGATIAEQGTAAYLDAALGDLRAGDGEVGELLTSAAADGRLDYVLVRPVLGADGAVTGTQMQRFEH